eukprot:5745767-Amphidinium_carterae.2
MGNAQRSGPSIPDTDRATYFHELLVMIMLLHACNHFSLKSHLQCGMAVSFACSLSHLFTREVSLTWENVSGDSGRHVLEFLAFVPVAQILDGALERRYYRDKIQAFKGLAV